MSLFNTLNTGASGMNASSTNLTVISDNIANIGTVGYKGSGTTFADAFPHLVSGIGGQARIGAGASLGSVALDFTQGTLTTTGSALDVAMVGQGFFTVSDGEDVFFTRDGSFHLDDESYLVNAAGMRVQGYGAINGTLTTVLGDLQISPEPLPQKSTENVNITATLSADTDNATEPLADLRLATPLDGTAGAPTLEELSEVGDFDTSITVYDSLGLGHDVTLFFERSNVDGSTWNVYAVVDGAEVDTNGDGVPDGVAGSAFEIGSGTVTFDTEGNLVSTSGIAVNAGWTFPGADPFSTDFNFGLDPAGQPTDGALTMVGDESFLTTISQDGFPSGSLESLFVEPDGTIVGNYTNGEEQFLGQLAVATFDAVSGLDRVGGNLFAATHRSGIPAIGVAGTGSRGQVSGYSLETANVGLEDQFVRMIQAQRLYQASTGVIQAADEALQQLIQLV